MGQAGKMTEFEAYFQALIDQRQLSHGYLLSGSQSENKLALVNYIIAALCQSNQELQAEEITQLEERLEAEQYADVSHLRPDGAFIRVDQIRELRQWLTSSPIEGNFKVALIHQADQLNQASANALLTVLEEPVANVYLFLLAPSADRLLPTIVSRVQEIFLAGDSQADRYQALVAADYGVDHAQVLSRLSYETSQELLVDYEAAAFSQWLEAWQAFYLELAMAQPRAFVTIQRKLRADLSRSKALAAVEYLYLLNYQALMAEWTQLEDSLLTTANLSTLQKGGVSSATFISIHQALLDCKRAILANVSPQLALEGLAIRLAEW